MNDYQSALLEELSYLIKPLNLDKFVAPPPKTVKEIIEIALKKGEELDLSGGKKDPNIAKHTRDLLEQIINDPEVGSLVLDDVDPDVHALRYHNSNTGKVYVTFQGTTGADEWKDDAEGLNTSDTDSQRQALNYIEGIESDDITVIGHSKGGNKAQYVAILSDKVTECYSFDGQGFSQEFLDKYWAEIETGHGKIHAYATSGDPVHALLFTIPGVMVQYVTPTPGTNGIDYHEFLSFFQFDNNQSLKYTDNPEEFVTTLHGFTCFVLNVATDKQKENIMILLRDILYLNGMGEKDKPLYFNGVYYDKNDILKYLLANKESFALLLSYLFTYIDTYKLSDEEIYSLLEFVGLDELYSVFKDYTSSKNPTLVQSLLSKGEGELIRWFLGILSGKASGNLNIGEAAFLEILSLWCKSKGYDIDLVAFVGMVGALRLTIPLFDKNKAREEGKIKSGKKYDYSLAMIEKVMNTIDYVNSKTVDTTQSWAQYSGEEWYNGLFISTFRNAIIRYISNVGNVNDRSKKDIEIIFENVGSIDKKYSNKIQKSSQKFNKVSKSFSKLKTQIKI